MTESPFLSLFLACITKNSIAKSAISQHFLITDKEETISIFFRKLFPNNRKSKMVILIIKRDSIHIAYLLK